MRDAVREVSGIMDRLQRELAGAQFAYVFGSILGGGFGGESDVDVAADFGAPMPPGRRLGLIAALAAAVGRDVDLVDLRAADPIIRMQVLKHGRLVVCNDPISCHAFAMTTLSEYFDLKLDRAPVEAMIARPRALQG